MSDPLVEHPRASRRFEPPSLWARGPHAQTLLARVLRSADGPAFTRERLETPDGDFLDVDWGPEPVPGAPIVVVLHGLEGSSRRRYVRNVCRELLSRGVRPLAMNFRGCSGEPNRALRFYHSGDTADVAWLLGLVSERHPGRPLGLMGFSLGGNVTLKLLGEGGAAAGLVAAAAAMSVPYDLAAGSALLERSLMGRLYSEYFLRSLRMKVEWKRERLADALDMAVVDAASTIRAFDDAVTAPLNGFADAAEYYDVSSSARYLDGIRAPTLLVHAVDDPFLPPTSIPTEAAAANPALRLSLSERGGHVGFVRGAPWRPEFWADAAVADHLATSLR